MTRVTAPAARVGNRAVPCYKMYARKSNDNGASWLPDDAFSDVVTPLPAQNDPSISTQLTQATTTTARRYH